MRLGQLGERLLGGILNGSARRIERDVAAVQKRQAELGPAGADALAALVADVRKRESSVVERLALAAEAARRGLALVPHETQIRAALHLCAGRLIEMATGEGKTLVAALAGGAEALSGRVVHVVTANDYLAVRDRDWMAPLYALLGLSAGCRRRGQDHAERRAAHECDILYSTAAELSFDHLMDGLREQRDTAVCRAFDLAVFDEADHILLDDAVNPLVITGDIAADAEACRAADAFVAALAPEHYEIDAIRREVSLTEAGIARAEQWFAERNAQGSPSLFDEANLAMANRIAQALRARHAYARDRDYVVQDGGVAVLDPRTGRTTRGRFAEGLQQALEAREGVALSPEQVPIASLSMRAFGRLYARPAGMTGTAAADAGEFADVYGLEVVPIGPAVPSRRIDQPDRIYGTAAERLHALAALVQERHTRGQPILIGTPTIAASEAISARLAAAGLKHRVLHAHFLAEEAAIVAAAGRWQAITIATNVAGRGTDIELGGPARADAAGRAREREAVAAAGGLLVIGAERQRLRRLDDQLRGRAGRRGDPGETLFLASLEDDVFAPMRGASLLEAAARSARDDDGCLLDPAFARMIAAIQERNRTTAQAGRASTRRYDEIIDRQFAAFQRLRESFLVPQSPAPADRARLADAIADFAGAETRPRLGALADDALLGLGRRLVAALDADWRWHVHALDILRQGVGWRALGGRDPFVEFGKEALQHFAALQEAGRALVRTSLT